MILKRCFAPFLFKILILVAFTPIAAFSAAQEQSQSDTATRIDFTDTALQTLPKAFTAVSLVPNRAPGFRLSDSGGQRALHDGSAIGGDVFYYKTVEPLSSVEESYTFVYSDPTSVVEPFIVNASSKNPASIAGFKTDLSASRPNYHYAGNISYRYVDDAGQEHQAQQGRLRTEPYFYRIGHTYRVDAIAGGPDGILSTRVYDVALGPQTFDLNVKTSNTHLHLYPGLLVHGRAAVIMDFAFGLAGKLPVRPHVALRAGDYMNYLGYNAVVSGPSTSPLSLAFQHYFPELLIKHIRVSDEMRFQPSLNAVARFGINADVLTGNRTTLESLNRFISGLALPPDAIELWNEPNNPYEGAAYDAQYAAHLPAFAAQVAAAYPHTKIWGPSILPDPNGYPSATQKLAASLRTYISAWNAHSYTQGTPENLGYGGYFGNACGDSHKEDCGWYGAVNYNDNLSAVINPSLPGITTEGAASYGSYPNICGHSNVDAATQQAYIERGMLYNFKLGHLRIFPYKFIDDGGCSDGFGTYGIMSRVVDTDGQLTISPKPAYVSLVYLDHILADASAQAMSFTPKPLLFALDGATSDIEQLLLAQADGSYRLLLWSDKSLWDFNANGPHAAGSAKPLSNQTVNINFDGQMNATIYTQTPGTGAWVAGDTKHSTSINVVVNQYPLVISIARATGSEPIITLPRDVPTPGPTETPRAKRFPSSKPGL